MSSGLFFCMSASTDFKPVELKTKTEIGSPQEEGHELVRLILLLLREQIRKQYYATFDELNWSQVAAHINKAVVRRERGERRPAMSDDTLRVIADRVIRNRSNTSLEVIGCLTVNPLTGKTFTLYDMLAILRADRSFFPAFDELKGRLQEEFEHGKMIDESVGAFGVARVIDYTLDWCGREHQGKPFTIEEFTEYLNSKVGANHFAKEDLDRAVKPPDQDYKQPFLLIVTLQSLDLVRNPKTGERYSDTSALNLILRGQMRVDGGAGREPSSSKS